MNLYFHLVKDSSFFGCLPLLKEGMSSCLALPAMTILFSISCISFHACDQWSPHSHTPLTSVSALSSSRTLTLSLTLQSEWQNCHHHHHRWSVAEVWGSRGGRRQWCITTVELTGSFLRCIIALFFLSFCLFVVYNKSQPHWVFPLLPYIIAALQVRTPLVKWVGLHLSIVLFTLLFFSQRRCLVSCTVHDGCSQSSVYLCAADCILNHS